MNENIETARRILQEAAERIDNDLGVTLTRVDFLWEDRINYNKVRFVLNDIKIEAILD